MEIQEMSEEVKLVKIQLSCQMMLQSLLEEGHDLGIENIFEVSYAIGSSIASVYYDTIDFADSDKNEVKEFFTDLGKVMIQGYIDKVHLLINEDDDGSDLTIFTVT